MAGTAVRARIWSEPNEIKDTSLFLANSIVADLDNFDEAKTEAVIKSWRP
ncbi:MAG: hypothetical protein IT307_12520 [Chloroflexi bacterium]|nr:hypothetical protein [Chloroflexota bacterium]